MFAPIFCRHRLTRFAMICGLASSSVAITHADQVIPDDLIVQSSGCFGFDSVDGESFGFDTIRLKENNLRIHFEDTSTSAGYPANDWRLVANDSSSEGGNYFAIEDSTAAVVPFRVDAGAPANSLRIENTGFVGIGTGDPGLQLNLKKNDTPAVRFEQDNTNGFTAQTWDVAGNEANFFVRDVTGGSLLPFRIRPGAPTSSIDIAATGNVGIGISNASSKLHVSGNALITGTLEIGSSRSLKEGIRDLSLEDAQAAFAALKPVHFKYKTEAEQQLGFIAEDVPDLVATDSRKSLAPMDFVAVLTKVTQEQDRRVRELEKSVAARDEAIQALTRRLEALERGATARLNTAPALNEKHEVTAQRRDQPVAAPVVKEAANPKVTPVAQPNNGR
jgi:hypothetical protein